MALCIINQYPVRFGEARPHHLFRKAPCIAFCNQFPSSHPLSFCNLFNLIALYVLHESLSSHLDAITEANYRVLLSPFVDKKIFARRKGKMPCLFRYRWLKLPRAALPQGKGLSAYWAKLAARAAFRKGVASYCGHENPVEPGMWSGGVVGLKSILGVKKRERALEILEQLSSHGYLSYELNPETKQLTYRITDWEMDHCGSECESGNVYTTPGYGFLCVPRRITERLLSLQYYKCEESDAF